MHLIVSAHSRRQTAPPVAAPDRRAEYRTAGESRRGRPAGIPRVTEPAGAAGPPATGWPYPAAMTEPKPGADDGPRSTDPTANAEPYPDSPTAEPAWSTDSPPPAPAPGAVPPPEPPSAALPPEPPGAVLPPEAAGGTGAPLPPGPPSEPPGPPGVASPPGYPPPTGYDPLGQPPYAPPPPPGAYSPQAPWRSGPDDTTWALLSHLSFFVLGIIGPLVVMLTKGKESGFVRDQAVESLNFHITTTLAAIVSGILIIVIIGIILLPAVLIGAAVLSIIGAVTASRGEAYRYPVNLRLVK